MNLKCLYFFIKLKYKTKNLNLGMIGNKKIYKNKMV